MAKKPLSDKQKAAIEKMRAARKTKAEAPVVPTPEVAAEIPAATPPVESQFQAAPAVDKDTMMMELMNRMMDFMQHNTAPAATPAEAVEEISKVKFGKNEVSSLVVSAQNGIQGQVFKYPVEKSYYPDPTDRLYDDIELQRFALRENFHIRWDVEGETYEKNNITYTEPRFIIELYKFMFDEETGEKQNQLARHARMFLHEDELVAIIIANRMGITEQFSDKEELLNEIRYRRIRQWFVELFKPAKVQKFRGRTRSMNINGKNVEVIDSEDVLADEEAADSKASSVSASL